MDFETGILIFLAAVMAVVAVMGWRYQKMKAQIRRTLRQDTDGSWTWVDVKGVPQRSGENPLTKLAKEEQEAGRNW